MRVILAGQRSFGAAAFEALQAHGHDVAAVWSPLEDPLTTRAARKGLWVEPSGREPVGVRRLDVDLFVAAHSHDFISTKARAATALGGVGYHPSLLPRHRGRDAVRWTIHMGDPVAGGSIYWLTDDVDGGPLAAQEMVHVVPGWDASDLWREELFPMGLRLLVKVLNDLDQMVLVEVPQDERVATWEPSWERPPLRRPDLTQIGTGPNGFHVRADRGAIR